MSEEYDLTRGDVWKTLIKFFMPVAAGTIIQQLYSTFDALIVGKYVGKVALAAVGGSVTQIFNVTVGVFVALTSGAAVVIAQLYGVNDHERIKKATATSMSVCAIIGVILTFVGIKFAKELLIYMKTPEDTLNDATLYLQVCSVAVVAVMLYNMGSGIIRAAGDSKRPFIYLCACCGLNIILDYVFVKIMGMGVFGAAVATSLSQFVSCILVLIRMFTSNDHYRMRLFSGSISSKEIGPMMRFGIPSAVQSLMYGISNALVQVAVNSLGTTTVAAWTLTGKVDGIYWAIIWAAGAAIMNFVGQNYGAGRLDRVRSALKLGMRNFMIVTVVLCSIILLCARSLFPFFVDDAQTSILAWRIMIIFVVPYPAWTVIELMSGMLKGCGDNFVPALITVVGICGVRLLWIYTIFAMNPTVEVLAVCYPVSWIIAAIALVLRYKSGAWKKRREI